MGYRIARKTAALKQDQIEKYGLLWNAVTDPVWMEMCMVQYGGRWKTKTTGVMVGEGLFTHFKRGISLLWPEVIQHRWFDFILERWLTHKYIGIIAPKNAGKTHSMAICHLFDYYCFPNETTVLLCSTTKEMLENRIWGEVKKFHKLARQRKNWIPGNLIEGKQRIVTDDRDEAEEGRDFRNGLMGIPLKRGNQFVGISDIIGIKNKRKRLCGDELQCLPRGFIDGTANFIEPGADCKVTGMGNPAETTDSLGILCEPHSSLGGWEGGIDQTPKTKSWETKFDDGVCIQLPGSDSPNFDVPEGEPPPFPFLMTRDQMAADARTWGINDWHYTMFNEGRMPRGQGSNRVITRQLCVRHRALEEPIWLNSKRTYITCLDAAYRAVGGDRCVLMRLAFGPEAEPLVEANGEANVSALINQGENKNPDRIIIALLNTIIIPIKASDFESPEDQIVMAVKMQHQEWNLPPDIFYYDAGMRTSLVTAFSRLWSPNVNSIDFGGKPSERKVSHDIDVSCRDYYSKFVTELWYSARMAIEAGQVRGMNEDLILEGSAREFKHVSGNRIEVETKEEMKVKTGKSPDLFDCFVIGIEGARRKGFIIRRMASREAVQTDNTWKDQLREKGKQVWHGSQLVHNV